MSPPLSPCKQHYSKYGQFLPVTSLPLNTGETSALPSLVITFLRTVPVTVALRAVLGGHRIPVEPWLAPFTAVTVRVRQTHLAQTGQVVASVEI